MQSQLAHAALPSASHDEAARQAFVQALKLHLATKVVPGNRAVFDQRTHGKMPESRRAVAEIMRVEPFYQLWGSLQRCSQEMCWDSVLASLQRQHYEIPQPKEPIGSLTLDDTVEAPAYLTALDIHCMPGGYTAEHAGPLYDRGGYIYAMGGWGADNGHMGRTVAEYIRATWPELAPARILDMGCGIGHGTLPYCDAFPDAELHAIDVAAPMLRYGHARAETMGKKVHFRQANAEATPYPDESFDLVVSHILLHETSASAIRRVMAECRRLLRPGGLALHVDLALYGDMSAFDAFMLDWDTHHNNEPFWGTFREMDPVRLMSEAGFAADEVVSVRVDRAGKAAHVFSDKRDAGGRKYWQIIGARKP